jgi:hypothetical protein
MYPLAYFRKYTFTRLLRTLAMTDAMPSLLVRYNESLLYTYTSPGKYSEKLKRYNSS